jgi:putative peptidoglycan lipid II flippase
MLFLLLPMTAGLMLMSTPLVRLLYEWKSWDSFSTQITARALGFMALGLVGYGVQNVLARAYYAGQDGKTPLISGAISIVVNLILCLLLTDKLDVAGLSLATAVSATVAALVLLIPTVRKYPKIFDRAFWLGLLKMLLATALMSLVVFGVYRAVLGVLSDGLVGRILVLGLPAAAGIVVYFAAAWLLKLPELRNLRK